MFAGTVLLTALTIAAVAQYETEHEIVQTQMDNAHNLLRTVLLNVHNEHQSLLFHRDAVLRERRQELANITALATGQIQRLFDRYQSGELPEGEAQHQAKELVRNMQYADGVGYLWIQNTDQPIPRLLMHGARPELDDTTPDDNPLFTEALDGKGNLFAVFTELCLRDGDGYVKYRWPKPMPGGSTEVQPKISHVRYFEPWQWVVGTGLYVDDVEREARRRLDAILDEIRDSFSQVRLAGTGFLFLFSGDGQVLVKPQIGDAELASYISPDKGERVLEELRAVADNSGQIWHNDLSRAANGQQSLMFPDHILVSRFEPLDWYIAAAVYDEDMRAPAVALRWKILTIAVFALLLAMALSWQFANHLSKPLSRLIQAVREVERDGIGSTSIPRTGTRETRELGQSLEGMIASIREATERSNRLLSELRTSEEDLRTTLNSIGDAVIATDIEGRVTRMNPVAETLTGWRSEELKGQPLAVGFQIVNARTGEKVEDPVDKVLNTGKTVDLANHTVLMARDGRQFQIADCAAPIRGSDRRIKGVVLVFRDVTEDYAVRDALREQQDLQREFFNNTAAVVYIKDTQGRYLFVNRMFESLFHVRLERLKGKRDEDIFPPEQAELFQINDRQVLVSGDTLEFEEHAPHADGDHVYISVKFPLRRASGEIFAVGGISTDITERMRAEAEVRGSSERLRLALQAAEMGTWEWDLGKDRIHWSEETLAIFGIDASQFEGSYEAYLSFVPAEAIEQVNQEVRRFLAAPGQSTTLLCEHPIRSGDGQHKWIEVRGSLVGDGADKERRLITGVYVDITARKAQQEELGKLRNYLGNIINSMSSLIIGVDRERRVTQWNNAVYQRTGISEQQALGQPLVDVCPRMAADLGRVDFAIRSRREQHERRRPVQLDGETRYEDISVFPLVADGAEHAVIRIDDVTEHMRIEELMIQNEKMLSVGGLAAGMAHEINNPLGGIMQTAEVMADRLSAELPKNHKVAEEAGTSMESVRAYMEARGIPRMLTTIREACSRAATIVDNMLGFARRGDASLVECDIPELLEQTLRLAGTDYDLRKRYDFKAIRIERDFEQPLPAIRCEPQKVQQVLMNIFSNGAQAMQAPGPDEEEGPAGNKPCFQLRLRYEPDAQMLRIEISDNGPGMEEEVRKHIFEPFFTTKPIGVGTGLGLSVAYFIVTENLGGTLSVLSEPGEGASFILRLPLDGAAGALNRGPAGIVGVAD